MKEKDDFQLYEGMNTRCYPEMDFDNASLEKFMLSWCVLSIDTYL